MKDILHEIIKDNGLSQDKVILVGGLAISFYIDLAVSRDVDFALVVEDYQKIQRTDEWGIKTVQYEWGYVDFLNPEHFVSEQHKGNEFISYIKQHRYFKKEGLYVANPEVVFYTRLVVPTWESHISKIIRDLNAGLIGKKDMIFKGIKAIADVFSTRDLINPRLNVLDQFIESYFNDSIKPKYLKGSKT
ncbi:Uncharacterised protein [uncultured archaeon]|nr:Uncharacterised protein [uncultured archaeon]